MAFDKSEWQEAIRQRLQQFAADAEGTWARARAAGVQTLFGYLVGMTAFPLAQAAAQGDLAGAFMTLGSIASGVGANLVANKIQAMHDEMEAGRVLEQEMCASAELFQAVDQIMAELGVVQAAQEALGDEWRVFAEQLKRELRDLGSLQLVQDQVRDSTVVAAKTIRESLIFRDINFYLGYKADFLPDTQTLEQTYLERIWRTCAPLRLGAMDPEADDPRQRCMELSAVYIALDTTTRLPVEGEGQERRRKELLPEMGREEETRPLSALEVANDERRLVLLGDPGSGKSTFVNHLALCLAGAHLDSEMGWLERLPGWTHGPLIPLPVTLRDFAAERPAGTAAALWQHVEGNLERYDLGEYGPHLKEALRAGEVVVFLDGLDEVPGEKLRQDVVKAVEEFAKSYGRARLVVTCRVLSYADRRWQLAGFPAHTLAPFDQEKIKAFVNAWYGELANTGRRTPEEGKFEAGLLSRALESRPELGRLAGNPLLLTVMALVHSFKGELPEKRARLYQECVDLLLLRWQRRKVSGEGEAPQPSVLEQLGVQETDLRRALWEVAHRAHYEQGERQEAADIPERDVLDILQRYLGGDWGKAQEFLGYVEERAGLLLGRGGVEGQVYAFPHRTFQEYLAGCYLAGQPDFPDRLRELVERGAYWREALLLAVGHLVYNQDDPYKPLYGAAALCPEKEPRREDDWRAVWWAGEMLAEMGVARAEREEAVGKPTLERARGRLVCLLAEGHLSARERAAAGRTLALLGDPRPGVCALPPEWVEIPAGPFIMGEGGKQHEVPLPAFRISRYPITNAQYELFVEAGGYAERRYWAEAEKAEVWQGGRVKGLWGEARDRQDDYGTPFNLPNHPVVGVTWYEAVAFCCWLTEHLRERGELEEGQEVRLPSEAEWEKAARGPDGREWPWGNEFDPARCNMRDTGIGAMSAVGIFPAGASPYGVLDAAGNGWEWCRSLYEDYPYRADDGRENLEPGGRRVLRGGSWYDIEGRARCASRGRNFPLYCVDFGFRVVLSPSSL